MFILWDIWYLTKNSSLSPQPDRYVKLKLWLTFIWSFGQKEIHINSYIWAKVLPKGRSIQSTWTGEKIPGSRWGLTKWRISIIQFTNFWFIFRYVCEFTIRITPNKKKESRVHKVLRIFIFFPPKEIWFPANLGLVLT